MAAVISIVLAIVSAIQKYGPVTQMVAASVESMVVALKPKDQATGVEVPEVEVRTTVQAALLTWGAITATAQRELDELAAKGV
jgi:hypothetical protein